MTDPDTVVDQLDRLRALGVRVGLDDFGTGYSSLSYLKAFPIDTLKIDRSFLRQITSDETDSMIVQAIVTLAHGLSLEVVAEGVEEIQQVERLRSLGCESCQGYHFSKPLNPEDAERYMAAVPRGVEAIGTGVNARDSGRPAPRVRAGTLRLPQRGHGHGGNTAIASGLFTSADPCFICRGSRPCADCVVGPRRGAFVGSGRIGLISGWTDHHGRPAPPPWP